MERWQIILSVLLQKLKRTNLPPGIRNAVPTIRSRSMRGAVLLAYCLLTIGLPVPASNGATKDSNQPFPCMDRPCGCTNPHDCWTHCCCFTAQQRVEWAAQNGYAVPSYAVLEDPQGDIHAESDSHTEAGSPSCCEEPAEACDCCASADRSHKPQAANESAKHGCCSEESGDKAIVSQRSVHSKARIVLEIFAAKCRGGSRNGFYTIACHLPISRIPLRVQVHCVSSSLAEQQQPKSRNVLPDVPPPRS